MPKKLEKLIRFLAVLPVIGVLFPYRCKQCGMPLAKVTVENLTKEERQQLGKDAWIIARYAYECRQCDQNYLVA